LLCRRRLSPWPSRRVRAKARGKPPGEGRGSEPPGEGVGSPLLKDGRRSGGFSDGEHAWQDDLVLHLPARDQGAVVTAL